MDVVERLAAEVREQNELYEGGQTDKAFWLGQQNRLKAIKEADPSLTHEQLGELVGKGKAWVSRVLNWDVARAQQPNWGSGSNKRDDVARKAIERDPGIVARAIEANPEIVRQVAPSIAKAIETPEVADAVMKSATAEGRLRMTNAQRKAEDESPSFQKAKAKAAATDHDKRQRQSWMLIEQEMGKARRALREMMMLVRETELDDEWRELHIEDVAELADMVEALQVAIIKGETVDWDAELAKLEDS